jgi:AraC family transcriptional regulator
MIKEYPFGPVRHGEERGDNSMLDGRRAKGLARAATFPSVQPLLAYAAAKLDDDVSLTALAGKANLSAFYLHRIFSAAVGETPKQFTMRLRLGQAAATLLVTDDSVLSVALSCGFQSHEVFVRAFRRSFGMTPGAYRRRGFANRVSTMQARQHAALVSQVGPCIALYHINKRKEPEMTYIIKRTEHSPQPVLVIRRRVKLSEIGTTLAEVLPSVFKHAQQTGAGIAGQPFTRYVEWGPGLVTIEAGLPVVAPGNNVRGGESASDDAAGGPEIVADCLPGGPVATVTHSGPYEKLAEAHTAIQQWIEDQGLRAAGPPWEVYTTDPADYPDPQDWKTDVFWPLAR